MIVWAHAEHAQCSLLAPPRQAQLMWRQGAIISLAEREIDSTSAVVLSQSSLQHPKYVSPGTLILCVVCVRPLEPTHPTRHTRRPNERFRVEWQATLHPGQRE